MRAYGGMVLSVCYKVTKDAADAEDASQAVFLTLAVQCKTGSPIQYLGPWLKKVAKRTALDLVRSRKRRTRRETVTAENRPEHYTVRPGAAPEADELNAIIRAELDELPGKYKMPLVLHYFGGLSHDQISREMKCTTAALGVRLHRARKMLGKRLSARGISLEGAALSTALAAAIPAVFTERFIGSTQAAAMGIAFSQPVAMGAMPDNFGAVLALVQQVGHSMAKARLRMATVALAASVTLLGGAAEAVRHLPLSMRPDLDFLAPSRLLKTLFEPTLTVPRLHVPTPAVQVAMTAPVETSVASAYTVAPPTSLLTAAKNQPILALQWTPLLVPPPAPAAPMPLPKLTLSTAAAPRSVGYTTLADAAERPEARPRTARRNDTFHAPAPVGIDSAPATPAETPAAAAPRSGPRRRSAIASAPPPEAFDRSDPKAGATQSVRGFEASAVGGATSGGVPVAAIDPLRRPTGPTPLPSGSDAFVPDSVILGPRGLFVAGNGTYHWADRSAGIAAGGVNSVDFTLSGVAPGGGVVAVDRLPVTTTLAPTRPTGHTFVGIWSLNSTADFDTIRLTAHYDAALAESLGLPEDVLKLWVYDDGAWSRIMDASFARDMLNDTLSGTYDATPQFFAVSAPEPTVLGVLAVGAYGLLRRRSRNR